MELAEAESSEHVLFLFYFPLCSMHGRVDSATEEFSSPSDFFSVLLQRAVGVSKEKNCAHAAAATGSRERAGRRSRSEEADGAGGAGVAKVRPNSFNDAEGNSFTGAGSRLRLPGPERQRS